MEMATSSSMKDVTPDPNGPCLMISSIKRSNLTKNKLMGPSPLKKGKGNMATPVKDPQSSPFKGSSSATEENSDYLFPAEGFYSSIEESSPQKKYFNFVLGENQIVMKKQTKMYTCDVCGATYRHVFSLKRHFLRNHVTVKYISKADISNCKIITHHDGEPESVSVLNDSDDSSMSSRGSENKKLRRSSESTTNSNINEGMEGLFRCHLCSNNRFDTKLELKSHYSIHPNTSKVRFPCTKCGAIFSHKQTLLRHLLTHATSTSTFPCKVCGKRFDSKPTYIKHMHMHTDSRRCKYCSKILSTTANKRRHERIHEGLKPYPCKHCDAQFSQSGDLKKHLKQQHQVAHFSCTLCRAVFPSKAALTKHTLDSHSSEALSKSPPKESSPPAIATHVQSPKNVKEKQTAIISKTFPCNVCKKPCPTYIGMLRHRRINHPFLHTRKLHKKIKYPQPQAPPPRILPKRNISRQKMEQEFYLSVSSMIADNLLNHVDGKTSQLSLRQYNFSDHMDHCTPIPTHPWSCYNFPSDFDVDLALRNRGQEIKNKPCESIIPFTDTFASNGFEHFNCDSNGVYDFSNHVNNSNSDTSDSEDANTDNPNFSAIDLEERKKMIGHEVQSILMCGACKDKFSSREAFDDHCENNHPNVLCTYIEIEGDNGIPPIIPEDLSRQFLSPIGIYFSCNVPPPVSEKSSINCTKCKSVFASAPELHEHIIQCGGKEITMKHVRKLFPERKIKRTMKSRMNTNLKPTFTTKPPPEPEIPKIPKAVSFNSDIHSKMYKNLMDFRPKPSVGRPRLNLCINCPHCTQTFRTKTLLNAHVSSCYRRKFHKNRSLKVTNTVEKKSIPTKPLNQPGLSSGGKGRKKLNNIVPHRNNVKEKALTDQSVQNSPVASHAVCEASPKALANKKVQKTIPLELNVNAQQDLAIMPAQISPLPKSIKHKSQETPTSDRPAVRESLTMHIALLPTPSIRRISSKETPSNSTPTAEKSVQKSSVKHKLQKKQSSNPIPTVDKPQIPPLQKPSFECKLSKATSSNSTPDAQQQATNGVTSNPQIESPLSHMPAVDEPNAKPSVPLPKSHIKRNSLKRTPTASIEESLSTKPKLSVKRKLPKESTLPPNKKAIPTDVNSNMPNAITQTDAASKEIVLNSTPKSFLNPPVTLDSILNGAKLNLTPVVTESISSSAVSADNSFLTETASNQINMSVTRSGAKPTSSQQKVKKTILNTPPNLLLTPTSRIENNMFVPVTALKESMPKNISGAAICPTFTVNTDNQSSETKIDSPRERLSPSLETLINSINEKLHSDELSPSHPTFSWMEDEHVIIPPFKQYPSSSMQSDNLIHQRFGCSIPPDDQSIQEMVNDLINEVEYSVIQDLPVPDKELRCQSSIDSFLKDVECKFKEIGIPVSKEMLSQVSSAISPATSAEDFPLKLSFKLTVDESNCETSTNPSSKKPVSLRSFRRTSKVSSTTSNGNSSLEGVASSSKTPVDSEKPEQNESIRCPYCLLHFKYFLSFRRHTDMCQKRLEQAQLEPTPKSPCVLHLPKKDEVEESMLILLRHQSRQSQIMKEAKPDVTEDKRLHTYTCEDCHKIFLSLFKLIQHRVDHKLQNADDQDSACFEQNPQPSCSKQDHMPKVEVNSSQENNEISTSVNSNYIVSLLLQNVLEQVVTLYSSYYVPVNEQPMTESSDLSNSVEVVTHTESDSTSNQCIADLGVEDSVAVLSDTDNRNSVANTLALKSGANIELIIEIKKNMVNNEKISDSADMNNSHLDASNMDLKTDGDVNDESKSMVDCKTNNGVESQESSLIESPEVALKSIKTKCRKLCNTKIGTRVKKRCWGRKNWVVRKTHVKSVAAKRKAALNADLTTLNADLTTLNADLTTVNASNTGDLTAAIVEKAAVDTDEINVSDLTAVTENGEAGADESSQISIAVIDNIISNEENPLDTELIEITTKQVTVQKRRRKKRKRKFSTLTLRSKLAKLKGTGAKQTINSHMKIKKKYKKAVTKKSLKEPLGILEAISETPATVPEQDLIIKAIEDIKPPKPLKRKYTRRKFPQKSLCNQDSKSSFLVIEDNTNLNASTIESSTDVKPVIKIKKRRKKMKKLVVRKRQGLKPGQLPRKQTVELPSTSTSALNLVQDVTDFKPKVKRGRKKTIKLGEGEFPLEKFSGSMLNNPDETKEIQEAKPVIKSVKRGRNSARMNSVQDTKNDGLHSSPSDVIPSLTIKIEDESQPSTLEVSVASSSKPAPKKPGKVGRPPSKRCRFCQKIFYSHNFKKRHIELKHKGKHRGLQVEKISMKTKLFKKKRRAFKRQCKTGPVPKNVRDTKFALPPKKEKK